MTVDIAATIVFMLNCMLPIDKTNGRRRSALRSTMMSVAVATMDIAAARNSQAN
jgi:hypothetical protein